MDQWWNCQWIGCWWVGSQKVGGIPVAVGESVVGGRWIGSDKVSGLVVSGRWLVGQEKTCRWVGGWLSVAAALSVDGGFVMSCF